MAAPRRKPIVKKASSRAEAQDQALESDDELNTDAEFVDAMARICEWIRDGTCDPYMVDIKNAVDERLERAALERATAYRQIQKAKEVKELKAPKPTETVHEKATDAPILATGVNYTITHPNYQGITIVYVGPSDKFPGKFKGRITKGTDKWAVGKVVSLPAKYWKAEPMFRPIAVIPVGYIGPEVHCLNCSAPFYRKSGRGGMKRVYCFDCRPAV